MLRLKVSYFFVLGYSLHLFNVLKLYVQCFNLTILVQYKYLLESRIPMHTKFGLFRLQPISESCSVLKWRYVAIPQKLIIVTELNI